MYSSRKEEIFSAYLEALDHHLADIVNGRVLEMMEINEIANELNIHPTHLSNTIKVATGHSACYFFEHKIIDIAKTLLEEDPRSVSAIAQLLTYDPSNFSKFFKAYVHQTPRQYRDDFLKNKRKSA